MTPTPLTARRAADRVAQVRAEARVLPRVRLAYSTATEVRPTPNDDWDPLYWDALDSYYDALLDCPGCNGEISKSAAVTIFGCTFCAE